MNPSALSRNAAALGGMLLALSISLPGVAEAQVSSRECPYNCESAGIPRSQCKDWRAEGKCFVEDLRTDPRRDDPRARLGFEREERDGRYDRDITMVNETVTPDDDEEVELHDAPIERIDVVARRSRGSSDTELVLALEDSPPLRAQQVDREENHVLSWQLDGVNPRGRELELWTRNGEVFVESVHVFYARGGDSRRDDDYRRRDDRDYRSRDDSDYRYRYDNDYRRRDDDRGIFGW